MIVAIHLVGYVCALRVYICIAENRLGGYIDTRRNIKF